MDEEDLFFGFLGRHARMDRQGRFAATTLLAEECDWLHGVVVSPASASQRQCAMAYLLCPCIVSS
jgi:hypothetical protein